MPEDSQVKATVDLASEMVDNHRAQEDGSCSGCPEGQEWPCATRLLAAWVVEMGKRL